MYCPVHTSYPLTIPIRAGKRNIQFLDQEVRVYFSVRSRKRIKPKLEAARLASSSEDFFRLGLWDIVKFGQVDPKEEPTRYYAVVRFRGARFTQLFCNKPSDAVNVLARALVIGARLHLELRVGRGILWPLVLDLRHKLV